MRHGLVKVATVDVTASEEEGGVRAGSALVK